MMAQVKLLISTLTALVLLFLITKVAAEAFQSPCPRFFEYDTTSNESDRWYGTLTLLTTDSDLLDVWIRLTFDRPSLQLGNRFGQVETTDGKVYHIKKNNHELKINVPEAVSFFLNYNRSLPAPRLLSFRLNGKLVCNGEVVDANPSNRTQIKQENVAQNVPQILDMNIDVNSVLSDSKNPREAQTNRIVFPNQIKAQTTTSQDRDKFITLGTITAAPFKTPPFISTSIRDKICGTIIPRPVPLIAFGGVTHEGEFPWHSALYSTKSVGLKYLCGASLVSNKYVITTAHCLRPQEPFQPKDLLVQLGKYYLKGFSVGSQERFVAKIALHSEFDLETFRNDVALVKLTTPVNITEYVRPICLWQEMIDITAVINKIGKVVGWGYDEKGMITEELIQAKMPIVSREKCVSSYPAFYKRFTSTNTYCAGYANGTSPCNGDTGGGMVFPISFSNERNPVWHLRGIISILPSQNEKLCDVTHYTIFTDVAMYLDWITEEIKL